MHSIFLSSLHYYIISIKLYRPPYVILAFINYITGFDFTLTGLHYSNLFALYVLNNSSQRSICACAHMRVCVCVCACARAFVCVCARARACMYACMHACVCVCVCLCARAYLCVCSRDVEWLCKHFVLIHLLSYIIFN